MGAFDAVYYFDPDIIVFAPWDVYKLWQSDGVPLVCEPSLFPMNVDHLKNKAFKSILEHAGLPFVPRDFYANAGFIALSRRHKDLLLAWKQTFQFLSPRSLEQVARDTGKDVRGVVKWADQEGLNMALRAVDVPVTVLGPDEGMGFGTLRSAAMFHAAGMRKPWRGGALADALRGRPPAGVHRAFLDFLDGPIPVLPRWRRMLFRTDYWAARAVSPIFRSV